MRCARVRWARGRGRGGRGPGRGAGVQEMRERPGEPPEGAREGWRVGIQAMKVTWFEPKQDNRGGVSVTTPVTSRMSAMAMAAPSARATARCATAAAARQARRRARAAAAARADAAGAPAMACRDACSCSSSSCIKRRSCGWQKDTSVCACKHRYRSVPVLRACAPPRRPPPCPPGLAGLLYYSHASSTPSVPRRRRWGGRRPPPPRGEQGRRHRCGDEGRQMSVCMVL